MNLFLILLLELLGQSGEDRQTRLQRVHQQTTHLQLPGTTVR